MEQKRSKKIFHMCMIIVIIVAILFIVGILILRYQVEGETNMPYDISKITVISSTDAKDAADGVNRWNMTINQNNDIYVYIDKNNFYAKTEIIDSVVIDNFVIDKQGQKGEIHIYKPAEENTAIFKNSEENVAHEVIYTGDTESDIKKLKISNQGGLVVLRCANDNIATYTSPDAEEVNYGKLLQNTNTTNDDLKAKITFDLTINLTSGKVYKATISIDIPVNGIVENGTSSQEITDLKDVVFKRTQNN